MTLEHVRQELERLREAERICAQTPQGKALLVMDHILTVIDTRDPFLNTLYKIAHSATGVCGNPHEDWKRETNELYDKIKEV